MSDSSNSSPSRNSLLMQSNKTNPHVRGDRIGDIRFAVITTTIIVLSYITAMTVSSFEKVLAYVGSTGSTSISFILPGLLYYKISAPDSAHHQKLLKEDDDEEEGSDRDDDEGLLGGSGPRTDSMKRYLLRKLSLGLAIYGFVIMIVCLVTNTMFVVLH